MFALAFLLLCAAAHADLYRWVDPESGSVKFSNAPPPWYDTDQGPKVEVIPSAPQTAAQPSFADMQARWREMLLNVSSKPTPEGVLAFRQLTAQFDRVDPAGAARRKEEVNEVMRRLTKQ